MSSTPEIVKRLKAKSFHSAEFAKAIATVEREILPKTEAGLQQIVNAQSGQEKALQVAQEALAEAQQMLNEILSLSRFAQDGAAQVGAGFYQSLEAFEGAEQLAATLEDIAQVMEMWDLWAQASPEFVGNVLNNATEYTLKVALQKATPATRAKIKDQLDD